MFTTETATKEFWNRCYRPLKLGGASPRTIEDHVSQLSNFDRIFRVLQQNNGGEERDSRLGDLTDETLAEVMAYRLSEGRSKATANKIHTVICPIWNFARKKKVLHTLPCVDKYPVPKRVRAVPTPDQFELILAACQRANYMISYKRRRVPARVFWPALIAMDVNLGVRINALMSIRKQDCDLDQERVLVRGERQKHRADEWFDLLPRTIELLRPLWAWQTDLVFPWPFDPSEFQWQTLRRHFRRILEASGLPASSEHMFHCFRRYAGTRVTRALGIEAARQYLGQSCVSVTRRYVDPIQGCETKTAAQAFPELMGPSHPEPTVPPTSPPPTWVPPAANHSAGHMPSGRPHLRVFSGDTIAG